MVDSVFDVDDSDAFTPEPVVRGADAIQVLTWNFLVRLIAGADSHGVESEKAQSCTQEGCSGTESSNN